MANLRFSVHYIYDYPFVDDTGAGFTLFDYRCHPFVDAELLNNELFALWAPLLAAATSIRAKFVGSTLYDLDAGGWPVAIAEDLSHDERGDGAVGLPSQNCVVVKRRDAAGGKSGSGRIFISPVSLDCMAFDENGDLVNPGYMPLVQIADQMKTTVTTAGGGACTPIIWHRSSNTGTTVVETKVQEILCMRRSKRTWRFDDVPQW